MRSVRRINFLYLGSVRIQNLILVHEVLAAPQDVVAAININQSTSAVGQSTADPAEAELPPSAPRGQDQRQDGQHQRLPGQHDQRGGPHRRHRPGRPPRQVVVPFPPSQLRRLHQPPSVIPR